MIKDDEYKKILILGVTFADNTANGVTLTNLFKNWPKDKILAASDVIDKEFCERERPCAAYYSFQNKYFVDKAVIPPRRSGVKRIVHSLLHYVSEKIGRGDLQPERRINSDFLQFIDQNKPDIFYTALGSLCEMRFIEKLTKKRNIPIAIHIYDDWPRARFNGRWLECVWKKIYDYRFKRIVNNAAVRLSICDEMSKEYERRYGFNFYGFHNPVDIEEWDAAKPIKKNEEKKSILYMGKVNYSTLPTLLDLSEAATRVNMSVHILSPHITEDILSQFKEYPNTKLELSNYPHSYLPVLLKSHDYLFLPIGFDKNSISYYRYSMLTKLAEYLIAAVPIVLYCPKEIALYKYCVSRKCVYPCEEGISQIENALSVLLHDSELGQRLAENAHALAVCEHSSLKVQELLATIINNAE